MLIALLGAECTGKSTLAQALARDLGGVWVPEVLRAWCLREGRTPRADEQAAIAASQQALIEAATAPCVIADTTPLMTAVYSLHYFADDRLLAPALAWHRRVDHTLLCAPDGIDWTPDAHLRDGDDARQAVHAALQALLRREALPHTCLHGDLDNRRRLALAQCRP